MFSSCNTNLRSAFSLDKERIEREISSELTQNFPTSPQKQQPLLILIGGFQGAGKSTLINRIQKQYALTVVCKDEIRQALLNRDIKISAEFSSAVNNICVNLVKTALNTGAHVIIDGNAHSKNIKEMEQLVNENNRRYLIIKIFLDCPPELLHKRVRERPSVPTSYQGTESDLLASLSSIKINRKEYDLIVDTEKEEESAVFNTVNNFLSQLGFGAGT